MLKLIQLYGYAEFLEPYCLLPRIFDTINIHKHFFLLLCTETICNQTIPNGEISQTCGNRVDDTCDNFSCDYGYHKTDMVDTFNCTDSSDWSYNVSLLCIGKYIE